MITTIERDSMGPVVVETNGSTQKVYWGSGAACFYLRHTPEYWEREWEISGRPDPYRYIDLRNFDSNDLDAALGIL